MEAEARACTASRGRRTTASPQLAIVLPIPAACACADGTALAIAVQPRRRCPSLGDGWQGVHFEARRTTTLVLYNSREPGTQSARVTRRAEEPPPAQRLLPRANRRGARQPDGAADTYPFGPSRMFRRLLTRRPLGAGIDVFFLLGSTCSPCRRSTPWLLWSESHRSTVMTAPLERGSQRSGPTQVRSL